MAKRGVLVRAAISAALLAVTAPFVDWNAVYESLRSSGPLSAIGAIFLSLLLVPVQAYRWSRVIRMLGAEPTFTRLCRTYFIACFAGLFLPGTVGGDAVRIMMLSRESGSPLAVKSVMLDRIAGIAGLVAVATAAALAALTMGVEAAADIVASVALGIGALLVLAAGVAVAATENPVTRLLPDRLRTVRSEAASAFMAWRRRPGAFAVAMLLSVGIQIGTVAVAWFVGVSTALHAPILLLLVVVPTVTLVTMLPLSFNGIGIQDLGFLALLAPTGATAATIVAFSVLWHGLRYAAGIVGLFLYIARGEKRQAVAPMTP
jgi:uncharacterized protein (TIRG00374 family)